MSKSDNNSRLPKANTLTITESDDMGDYTFTLPGVKRSTHVYDRQQKREMAQSGCGRKAQIVDLDMQEQMREVLLAPAYTGTVGTHTGKGYFDRTAFANDLPSRKEVEFSVLYGAREVRLSDCKFGCKVMRTHEGDEYLFHSSVYGHDTSSVEVLGKCVSRGTRKIEPVVSRTRRVSNDSERENYRREREMRDLGFGARYGIHL